MELCEDCGASLTSGAGPSLRCEECGRENGSRDLIFSCGDGEREACDWCTEDLCVLCTRLGAIAAEAA